MVQSGLFQFINERLLGLDHRDVAQLLEIADLVEIEDRADVKLTRCGVAVVRGLEAERRHDRSQPVDVVGKPIGTHADILDAGGRLGRTGATREQRQPGLAQAPDQLLYSGGGEHQPSLAGSSGIEVGETVVGVVEELDQEHRLGRPPVKIEQLASGGEGALADGLIEEDAVDVLHRRRLELGDFDGGYGMYRRFPRLWSDPRRGEPPAEAPAGKLIPRTKPSQGRAVDV